MKETTFPKTVAIPANAPTTTTTEEVLFVLPFAIKGVRDGSTDRGYPFVIMSKKTGSQKPDWR